MPAATQPLPVPQCSAPARVAVVLVPAGRVEPVRAEPLPVAGDLPDRLVGWPVAASSGTTM